jgi:hypothetical protein
MRSVRESVERLNRMRAEMMDLKTLGQQVDAFIDFASKGGDPKKANKDDLKKFFQRWADSKDFDADEKTVIWKAVLRKLGLT